MAVTTTTAPPDAVPGDLGALAAKLRALRRAVRLWIVIDGACALICAAVGLGLLSLAVDYHLRMDRAQRAVCLALAGVGLAWVAWRRLVRPLLARLDDDHLCLRVEAGHRRLGECLINAVQFSRMLEAQTPRARTGSAPFSAKRKGGRHPSGPSPHRLAVSDLYSTAMLRATIEQGARAAEGLDFGEVLDRARRRRNLLQGGAVAALVAAAFALSPGVTGLWLGRNVLLGRAEWPRDTRLAILGAQAGALTLPRGDDLELRVVADAAGVVPPVVRLDYRALGADRGGTDDVNRVGDNEFPWRIENVQEPFELRARGGDDVTDWVRVNLVERPAVERLTLVAEPPAYTGRERRPLPQGAGAGSLPNGSRLEVQGRANKALASARLQPPGEGVEPVRMVVTGGEAFRSVIPADRLAPGTYGITLTDTGGLASRRPRRFSVKLVPDRKPVVRVKLEGIGEMITPSAVIPLQCDVSDDYAVADARLVCRHAESESVNAPPEALRLAEIEGALGRSKISRLCRFEVDRLKLAVGSVLSLYLEARDNDALTGPKTGLSGSFTLKVVNKEELLAHLMRREQELRLEFERLIREQKKLLQDSMAVQAAVRLRPKGDLEDKDRQLLVKNEKRQRLARGRCQSVASHFADILEEVRNNRLDEDGGAVSRRLGGRIIAPLRALARQSVPRAADHLDAAARNAGEPDRLAKSLADAVAEQRRIVTTMERILQDMVKWESYEEAVRLLRDILQAQDELRLETRKELERRIRDIFDKDR